MTDLDLDFVALAGLMGTGKSTVAELVAHALGFDFLDTDTYLDENYGPVEQIFDRDDGDDEFQRIEQLVVAELVARSNVVIATGGRTLHDPANKLALQTRGPLLCLEATNAELVSRLQRGGPTFRPRFAAASDKHALMAQLRAASQTALSDLPIVVTSHQTPQHVANHIVGLLENEYKWGQTPFVFRIAD